MVFNIIQYVADLSGRPYLLVKILLCFIIVALLSHVLYYIRNVKLRYAYSLIMGFGMQFYMYEWDIKHSVLMMLITYAIMRIFKREQQHIIVFVVLYIYQSIIHIEVMMRAWGQWGAEITAFTMNLVCKLISLAMCFRDGSPKCKGDSGNDLALDKMPSFFKILVYTFNLPSCIASPFYEYKDFEEWIELKGRYQQIPPTRYQGMKKFGFGFLYIAILAVLGLYYKVEFLSTKEFCEMTWYTQIFTQYLVCFAVGLGYFIAWSFVDSATTLSGLSYNGQSKRTGAIKFDRCENINVYEVWFGTYLKKIVYYWNMSIQYWMKKYVFMRIVKKGEDPPVWKFLSVFMISAFWHGFYPCYYIFFLTYGIYIFIVGELKYVYSDKFSFLPVYAQVSLAFIATWIMNVYFSASFMMYNFEDFLYHFNCINWWGHILLLSVFLFLISPVGQSIKRNKIKSNKQSKSRSKNGDTVKEKAQ